MDPYKVLGVSRTASDEEIKKAYRSLVKKYHPDQYGSNPLGDLAAEKLKSINEAYDLVTRERAGGKNGSSNYGGGSGYNNNYNTSGSTPEFARVRSFIQVGNLAQAEMLLESISIKSAEWHFLKGVIFQRKGFYDGARQHIQTAYNMESNNPEYATAFAQMNNQQTGYRNFYGNSANPENSCCEWLSCLCCANSCCDCFGGGCC